MAAAKAALEQKIISEIPEIIYDKNSKKTYKRGQFLGKGGFGRCYELTDMDSNAIFAGKILNKSLLFEQKLMERVNQEISIHRNLHHEYIASFHTHFEDDRNVYIILELCAKKSLRELVETRKYVTEPEARYFLRQIMMGVNYLHDNNVIHRDLKLDNIFIDDQMNLKLGDFGLATTIEFPGEKKKGHAGTANYIAPEVLAKKGHSFEVDVWSIGCILYTLLIGKPPFETTTLKDTYSKIKRADYIIPSNRISASAKHLIKIMLQLDPKLRPKPKDILQSNFLTKFHIPAQLPQTCLTMQPRFDNRASYAPLPGPASASSSSKRPSLHHNPRSSGPSRPASVKPPPTTTTTTTTTTTDDVLLYHQAAIYMRQLHRQLKSVLDQNLVIKSVGNDDEAEDPNSAPLLWIAKWVDYSDKYGFGYQLSDGSIGVSFNDFTRMVLLPDGVDVNYLDKRGCVHYYTKERFPTDLQKKFTLLNYFRQFMTENLLKAGGNIQISETVNMFSSPFLWKWSRAPEAVVMVLTNGTLQISNFQDHCKMILCPLMGGMTTLEHGKPMRTFKFSSIKENGCTLDLHHKLKYAFEQLAVVIGTKCPENGGQPVNQNPVSGGYNNYDHVQGQQQQADELDKTTIVEQFPVEDGDDIFLAEDDAFLAAMDIEY